MSLELWWLRRDGPSPAAVNMARDEALLEAIARFDRPVLRFYGWAEAAATFGYSQHYAEVERMTPLRPLIRRPTGGGVVPHDRDFTYSLVFPVSHSWYRLRARESYERVHEWLNEAFRRVGLRTQLAARPRTNRPGQCFVGAEQFDVLWRGVKVAGAAQRRTRRGLLIQGSVQPPAEGLSRDAWEVAVQAVATERWGIGWEPMPPDGDFEQQVLELARLKYETQAYNRRR